MKFIPFALLLFGYWSTAWAETTFTYQGKLGTSGQPAEGSHDFVFRLFDAQTDGTQVGVDQDVPSVDVDNGIFAVQLDFGDSPFNSSPRWLEIDVREAGSGPYTTLAPRQRIGASPFAIETLFVAPGAVDTAALQDNSVTTNKIANGNVFTDDLANFAVSTGKLSNQAVTQLKLANDSVGTSQIQNGSVSSSDIRDATIQSVDIADGSVSASDLAGGLYRSRSDLYQVTSEPLSVGAIPLRQTVACSDSNDLPLYARCGSPSSSSRLLATYMEPTNWTDTGFPAEAACSAMNLTPSNPGSNRIDVTVSIICVSVP